MTMLAVKHTVFRPIPGGFMCRVCNKKLTGPKDRDRHAATLGHKGTAATFFGQKAANRGKTRTLT